MKRGTILPLLLGLVLLFPAQTAAAKGIGHSDEASKSSSASSVANERAQDEDSKPAAKDSDKGRAHADRDSKPAATSGAAKGHGHGKGNHKPEKNHGRGHAKGPKSKATVAGSLPPGTKADPSCETATTALTVSLHAPHVGANSETFGNEPGDTGGLTDKVVWHFVLNGLDHGTEPATLTVTFKHAGTKTAVGKPVGNGSTQHFYVGTPTHDILLGGSAVVKSCEAGKLVLSHVAWTCAPKPGPGPEPPDDDEEPGPSVEPTPTPTPPSTPSVNDDDSDTDTTETAEPFLPFTGDPGALLISAALGFAMVGGRTRLWARSRRRR